MGPLDHVLADPQVIAVCTSRRVGVLFGLARRYAGLGPARIAHLTGLSTSRVSEYMQGQREVTSITVIERVADGLRIPGHMLGLAARPWETPAGPAPSYQPAAVPETWEILDMLSRSTASDAALSHLEAAVADVAWQYPASTPLSAAATLQRQLVSVHDLLGRPQQLAARRRCIRILTVVSGLLAFAHHDLGDRSRSDAHFHLGLVAAEEGEADDLTAWLLTMRSIVEYTAGRREPAATLLQRAQSLAASAGPRRRAWVTANLARSLAATGDRTAALATLDEAAALLAAAEGEPVGGLDFFTASRLDGLTGETYAHLGEHAAAAGLLESAIRCRSDADVKGRSVLTIDLAECRLGEGDVDAACSTAHAALDLADGAVINRLVLRAAQLQQALAPWQAARPVRELAERVRGSKLQLTRA